MNFYFMLRVPGLRGFVDLANFPPVALAGYQPTEAVAHVLWSDGKAWQVRDLASLPAGGSLRVREADLPADCPDPDEAGVFLCMTQSRLPRSLDALPQPDQPPTVPAWRANIGLASASTSVSYVGEYPAAMTRIPKGSLVSFSPFLQVGDDIDTKLLLVNLRHAPDQGTGTVSFADPVTRQVQAEARVRQNHVSVISLADLLPAPPGVCVSCSRDIAGIPLYLSHDPEGRELSLEHTHPPLEMALFGDRPKMQQNLKRWWFGRLVDADA